MAGGIKYFQTIFKDKLYKNYKVEKIIKKYSNGEVTIIWQPHLCTHSAICWRNADSLPQVFDPRKKPWVNPLGASTERIIEQINQCPSGALSYEMNRNE